MMTIIQDSTIVSLTDYAEAKKELLEQNRRENEGRAKRQHQLLVPERPGQCPECGELDCFWVHSYRYRWAIEGDLEEIIPIPRYECSRCTKVVSVLFAFLIPYRQFTTKAVGAALEMYATVISSYRQAAGEISDESRVSGDTCQRPAHAQVWQWMEVFASKAQTFLCLNLQRACVESGKSEAELISAGGLDCPNAERARCGGKPFRLKLAAVAVGLVALLLKRDAGRVEAMQAHFTQSVQNPCSMFTGRDIRLLAPHCSKHGF